MLCFWDSLSTISRCSWAYSVHGMRLKYFATQGSLDAIYPAILVQVLMEHGSQLLKKKTSWSLYRYMIRGRKEIRMLYYP